MMNRPLLFAWFVALLAVQNLAASQYESPPAGDDEEDEAVVVPSPDQPEAKPRTETAGLPYTPYPAGLSWVLTPQPFRVPIPNRIYYPPQHYVRRCPYYPRGYYWGANWRFNVVGRGNLLFFGPYRYNPYLTAAKAQHHPELRGQRRYAPPPGPQGQAVLLGSAPVQPMPLPPTLAKDDSDGSGKTEAQVATVRQAPDKRPVQPASSRRTAKRPIANSR